MTDDYPRTRITLAGQLEAGDTIVDDAGDLIVTHVGLRDDEIIVGLRDAGRFRATWTFALSDLVQVVNR